MYASNVLGFIENPDLVRRLLLSEGDAVDVCKILGLGGGAEHKVRCKKLAFAFEFCRCQNTNDHTTIRSRVIGASPESSRGGMVH